MSSLSETGIILTPDIIPAVHAEGRAARQLADSFGQVSKLIPYFSSAPIFGISHGEISFSAEQRRDGSFSILRAERLPEPKDPSQAFAIELLLVNCGTLPDATPHLPRITYEAGTAPSPHDKLTSTDLDLSDGIFTTDHVAIATNVAQDLTGRFVDFCLTPKGDEDPFGSPIESGEFERLSIAMRDHLEKEALTIPSLISLFTRKIERDSDSLHTVRFPTQGAQQQSSSGEKPFICFTRTTQGYQIAKLNERDPNGNLLAKQFVIGTNPYGAWQMLYDCRVFDSNNYKELKGEKDSMRLRSSVLLVIHGYSLLQEALRVARTHEGVSKTLEKE